MNKFVAKMLWFTPFLLLGVLTSVLWRGLHLDPQSREIPSELVNQNAPGFSAITINDATVTLTQADFLNHWSVLHVWATWCGTCRAEYPFWWVLAKEQPDVRLYSVAYHDEPAEVKKWLKKHGDPFTKTAVDESGEIMAPYGIYGVPQTFLIDPTGKVRFRYVGALNATTWQDKIMPIIEAKNS